MQKTFVSALILWFAGTILSVSADTADVDQYHSSEPLAAAESSINEALADEPAYSAATLYALLVAEMAGQRQLFDIALGNYLLEAHRTQDPGVAARATQIAQYIGADQAALDAATLWSKLDSYNPKAHTALSIELIKAQRFSEAAIHLQSALTLDGNTPVDYVSMQATQLSNYFPNSHHYCLI